jgi:hypothetical protein
MKRFEFEQHIRQVFLVILYAVLFEGLLVVGMRVE